MSHDQKKLETEVSEFWKTDNSFEKSNDIRPEHPFTMYDGPPFATGSPHFGHILVSIIKDTVARHENMCGHPVPRTFGWDCHGLPVENLAQQEMNVSTRDVLKNNRVADFNKTCRNLVFKCVDEWESTIDRIGRWVDYKNSYKTMDMSYMESVWWVFKQIYDQGRIYKAHRIMPYSPKLGTPLSNFEISDSYREVTDKFVVVSFPAVIGIKEILDTKDDIYDDNRLFPTPPGVSKYRKVHILVYTTTPWTLPSNVALCLNPKHNYSIVLVDRYYLVATDLIEKIFPKKKLQIIETKPGSAYAGITYTPLFQTAKKHTYKTVCDDYVSNTDGTGIVHIAPPYGEDDYRVGKNNNLPFIDLLDDECRFLDFKSFAGIFCKDTDDAIISLLKKEDRVYRHGNISHSYPFCDRTNAPIIYRAVDAWYLKLEDIRDRLLQNNEQINWVPESVGKNRFANWLTEAKDWNISRNRLWGSCIPIWESEDGERIVVGSIKELETLSGSSITDLHKDTLDKIVILKDGKLFKRVPEVLDCWFESGSMPYAQYHYPFENKEEFLESFPADFIVEGLDQTRGWFYTLLILSTLLFDKPPFKNVIVNGLILAEDGTKMSKSKNNFLPPTQVLDKYGADALRICLLNSQATHAEPFALKEENIFNSYGSIVLPFLNALDFYQTYSKIDKWNPNDATRKSDNIRLLDKWILHELNALIGDTSQSMRKYEIAKVLPRVATFLDSLCNWYIRLSRKLFWGQASNAKNDAYWTLHYTLSTLSKLVAPFIPFTAEHVNLQLGNNKSVHCEDYLYSYPVDQNFDMMDKVRELCELGHKVRAESKIRTRQPLRSAYVSFTDKALVKDDELFFLIKEELNVFDVIVMDEKSELNVFNYIVKPNFRVLGPKGYGKQAQALKALTNPTQADLGKGDVIPFTTQEHNDLYNKLKKGETVQLLGIPLTLADVEIELSPKENFKSSSSKVGAIVLDTTLDEHLYQLGFIADFRAAVQNIRKYANLHVTDRIYLEVFCEAKRTKALESFSPSLRKDLLATDIKFFPPTEVNEANAHKFYFHAGSLKTSTQVEENQVDSAELDKEPFYVNLYKELE